MIHRLENKLYGSDQQQTDDLAEADGPPQQQQHMQIVRERLLDDLYSRKERLEGMDLSRPEVGELLCMASILACVHDAMSACAEASPLNLN